MTDRNFKFHCPIEFFEKADEPESKQRRIGGLISTEAKDREGEVVLQRGLDFTEFLSHGWLNSNHSPDPHKVLGYPEKVEFVEKGAKLPNGKIAAHNGTWMEGYLIRGFKPADDIWELGKALAQGHGRSLGYSIEGSILKRSGPGNKIIARANVRNTAITHVPVNQETELVSLSKALKDAELEIDHDEAEKALTSTSGAALRPESLEGNDTREEHKQIAQEQKCMNKSEAIEWVQKNRPNYSRSIAERIVNLASAYRRSK